MIIPPESSEETREVPRRLYLEPDRQALVFPRSRGTKVQDLPQHRLYFFNLLDIDEADRLVGFLSPGGGSGYPYFFATRPFSILGAPALAETKVHHLGTEKDAAAAVFLDVKRALRKAIGGERLRFGGEDLLVVKDDGAGRRQHIIVAVIDEPADPDGHGEHG